MFMALLLHNPGALSPTDLAANPMLKPAKYLTEHHDWKIKKYDKADLYFTRECALVGHYNKALVGNLTRPRQDIADRLKGLIS